jgi:hypothetical protein
MTFFFFEPGPPFVAQVILLPLSSAGITGVHVPTCLAC